jgi:hypothetical protein
MHIPIKSGAIIPLLILLPNIIWVLLPHASTRDNVTVPLALNIAENAGRAAILIIPFFYSLTLEHRFSTAALVVACLALALYYVAWIRYFIGGRTLDLLGAPMLGISMPLAVAPTVLLVFSAYLLGSWPMLAASIWFGVAHIWVSALTL